MLQFQIVTIFPELFESFFRVSLLGKAVERGIVGFELIDLRDFTTDRHRSVDDTPYGGGAGMVMKPAPVFSMFDRYPESHKVFLTPQGTPFRQETAQRLSGVTRPLLLFCGRYEGLDERAVSAFDEQISLGDFVLNGGEVAAMALIEAVSRLVPEMVGNAHSVVEESFSGGLLEYPQYTRPELFRGMAVPQILLSGDHKKIADWRHGQALLRTRERRPELFERYEMNNEEHQLIAEASADGREEESES